MITTTFNITQIHIFPTRSGRENVVGRIEWIAIFDRGEAFCSQRGETFLPIPEIIDPFIDINLLTEQNLIDMLVAAEGGPSFIDTLAAQQISKLDISDKKVGMVPWLS